MRLAIATVALLWASTSSAHRWRVSGSRTPPEHRNLTDTDERGRLRDPLFEIDEEMCATSFGGSWRRAGMRRRGGRAGGRHVGAQQKPELESPRWTSRNRRQSYAARNADSRDDGGWRG